MLLAKIGFGIVSFVIFYGAVWVIPYGIYTLMLSKNTSKNKKKALRYLNRDNTPRRS